jgi:hypothetical protein
MDKYPKLMVLAFWSMTTFGAAVHAQNSTPATGLVLEDPAEYLKHEELPAVARGKLPSSRSLEAGFPKARSQGEKGSCAAFATSYAKSFRIYQATGNKGLAEDFLQSPAFVYSARSYQCEKGITIEDALSFLKNEGTVSWSDFPYDDKSCPDWRSVRQKAGNKSSNAFRLSPNGIEALRQIKEAVVDGNPVILAIEACSEFVDGAKSGYIMQAGSDGACPLHAILAIGFDNDIGAIQIRNSWGEDWGSHGSAWMSYPVFLKRYQRQAYVDFGPGYDPKSFALFQETDVSPVASPKPSPPAAPSTPNPASSTEAPNPASSTEAPNPASLTESRGFVSALERVVPLSSLGSRAFARRSARTVSTATPLAPATLVNSLSTNIADFTGKYAEISGVVKPVSTWSIWLNLPKEYVPLVDHVNYYFYEKSFRNPKKSMAGSSVFLAEWLGHGCAHNAKVVAFLKDGTHVESNFDFCAVLARNQPGSQRVFNDFAPEVSPSEDLKSLSTSFFSDKNAMLAATSGTVPLKSVTRSAGVLNVSKPRAFVTPEELARTELTGATHLQLGYLATKSGNFIVCKNAQPVGLECPAHSRSFEFSKDYTGKWKLQTIYVTGVSD